MKIENTKRDAQENIESIKILQNKIDSLEKRTMPEHSSNTSILRNRRFLLKRPSENDERSSFFSKEEEDYLNFK